MALLALHRAIVLVSVRVGSLLLDDLFTFKPVARLRLHRFSFAYHSDLATAMPLVFRERTLVRATVFQRLDTLALLLSF